MSKIIDLKNSAKELKSRLAKIQEEFSAEAEKTFTAVTAELFKEYPELKSITWRQYTPYFNDGETPEFGVGDFFLNGFDEYDEMNWPKDTVDIQTLAQDEKWDGKTFVKKKADPRAKKIVSEITELFKLVGDDSLKAIFGDHVSVTITEKGAETEHYEHE